jgi:2-dehydropantoate 2-reductase
MRIGVIGAGGIGGLYGGVLAHAGHEVAYLARGANLAALRARGLTVQSADFGTFTLRVQAADDPTELEPVELLLFTVKTYDLPAAAQAARAMLTPHGQLLTFQNGLEAPDQLAEVVGAGHVLIGTARVETTILEPGVIGHLTPGHQVSVSAFEGPPTPTVEAVASVLGDAGLRCVVEPDGRFALWSKAAILIPMATLTAVCRAPIGPIRDLPETHALASALLDEVTSVALAYGYDLSTATPQPGRVLFGAAPTMKASMARDFERGARTELEALTGALVRLAEARGVPVPTTRTAYAILKLRQQFETGVPPLGATSPGR